MKGLVVEAAGKICLREDLPLPEIDAYQVLCRNVGCGICNGTDMQLINGQMPFIQYPFVLGHEAVGQVVAVGEKVRSFQEGDYILRSALPGLPGYHSFWGGFAEYGVADDYAARLADHAGADIETSTRQLVPAGIDPVEATMLITLKEVASALHRLRLQPGQNVVVAGCGPVGIAMAALAKCMGAGKVVLAGHHPARIAAAKRLGADLAFDTREQPLADTVRGYMPEGVGLYIDAVGNPNLLMDGMRLIRQEGTIGLYGLGLRADAAIDWSLLPHNCILQTVQWPIAAQESAVHDEVCGRLPLREFVTHKIPVEDFAEGLRLVRGREGIKIALTF